MATDDPIIGECYLTISADKTEIIEGESVQFTIELFGGCSGDISVDIFINNVLIDSQYLSNGFLLYTHTFNESGEFIVSVDTGTGFSVEGDSIDITVEEATIELPTSQVSWKINNKNVQLIEINNKEVKSIITSNGEVLYRKGEDAENVLELQFTGADFSTYPNTSPFTYTGKVFVDWGDDTGLIEYTGGKLSHSYSANETYAIKIYGNITSFETHCFNSCSGLTSVIIPDSVTSFGNYCFYGCSGLASIIIPDSVTSLGNYCFYNCSGLTSVIISDSVTSLGDCCFYGCSNLTSIIIPNSVTNLGESCFSSCVNLTSVIIPDSVPSLKNNCFTNCHSLTSIIIPSGVTTLNNYCFSGCSNLTSINLNWDTSNKILTYNSYWISGANSNLKFIIPNGTTSLYTAKGYPSNKLIEIGNISLSSDKNILSYYDNDTATLSATVTSPSNEPVSGVTVEFFNGNTSLGTVITNSSGIATKTYASAGVGDVSFTASVGTISSETYSLEDCTYYKTTQYTTSSVTLNIPLPLHFSLEYVIKQMGSMNSVPYLDIGDSTNNRMLVGQYERAGTNGLITYLSTNTNYPYSSNPTFNQDNTVHFTYDGTDYTYWLNDLTPMTVSDKGVTLTKVIHVEGAKGGFLKDIKIKPLNSINLVANQSVLSYADSDSTTLTATHSLGAGKTVKLYDASDNTLIGAMTDNLDGTYSYTYNGRGIGDLTVYASDGNLVTEDYKIEDCWESYDGSSITGLSIDSGVSCTSNGSYITITTSTNSEKYVYLRTPLANDWQYEVEVAELGANQDLTFIFNIGGCWGAIAHGSSSFNITLNNGTARQYPFSGSVAGGKLKITSIDNRLTVYFNDTQLISETRDISGYKVGFYTNNGRVQKVKNIKLKPYQSKQSSAEDPIDELSGSD